MIAVRVLSFVLLALASVSVAKGGHPHADPKCEKSPGSRASPKCFKSLACPAVPSNATTKSNPKLPNPFAFVGDGSPVRTKDEWACRRAEISQLFQTYELGTLPGRPQSLNGTYSGGRLTINAGENGKSISFQATITLPSSGTAPYPAIIGVGGSSIPTPSGVAVITFNNNDMALQNDASSRGQGKFYQLYGTNHSASSMIAWTWGISRVIDVLETLPQVPINLKRLAVTGCSRNGKGAFVAGAFEERIALTIAQESGSGGSGCWRISDAMFADGIVTQTASEIVQENVWFSTNFANYVNNVPVLPFDHHMLAALVAPRALFVIDNPDYVWLGPESVWGCMSTGTKVFQALDLADHMGISQVGGHAHCNFPSNQQADLDAFVNKFLKGQNTNTNILRNDGNGYGYVESDWVDWSVPKLA